jgi:hypothetical protein
VRVHLAGKHALEFEALDFLSEPLGVAFDFVDRARVALGLGEFQKFRTVAQAAVELIESADDLFELGAFLAEFLSPLRVVPDLGLLEFPRYFLKALVLVVVIKDTSSRNRCAPRDL